MTNTSWAWSLDEYIPSQHGAGRPIIDWVIEHLEAQRWQQHDLFGVRLALEEAIVNAMKHGNGLDETKRVHIACRVAPDRMWAEIRDEGSGFSEDTVPDCTRSENLERPCGRGIMLMRNFMSRVCYNEQGNCVMMEKVLAHPS